MDNIHLNAPSSMLKRYNYYVVVYKTLNNIILSTLGQTEGKKDQELKFAFGGVTELNLVLYM